MLRTGVVQLTGDIASPGLGGPSSALDGEAGFRSVRRPPCASQRPRIRGIEHHQLLSPSAASKSTAHEYRNFSYRLPVINHRSVGSQRGPALSRARWSQWLRRAIAQGGARSACSSLASSSLPRWLRRVPPGPCHPQADLRPPHFPRLVQSPSQMQKLDVV